MNRRPAWYRSRTPKPHFQLLGGDSQFVRLAMTDGSTSMRLYFAAWRGSRPVRNAKISMWIDGKPYKKDFETDWDGHAEFYIRVPEKGSCINIRARCEFPDHTVLDVEENVTDEEA